MVFIDCTGQEWKRQMEGTTVGEIEKSIVYSPMARVAVGPL